MATKFYLKALILASALILQGCGIVYTSKTSPYIVNMNQTPVGEINSGLSAKSVSIPTTQLSAGWDSRAIGEIAKKSGLTEIYYADIYTFSLLAGLWREQQIVVYGRVASIIPHSSKAFEITAVD